MDDKYTMIKDALLDVKQTMGIKTKDNKSMQDIRRELKSYNTGYLEKLSGMKGASREEMISKLASERYRAEGKKVKDAPYAEKEFLPAKVKIQANKIASDFSTWLLPKELQEFYKRLNRIGVSVGIITGDASKGSKTTEVYYNGKEVDNCRFVYSVYKGRDDNPKNEYNMYFS